MVEPFLEPKVCPAILAGWGLGPGPGGGVCGGRGQVGKSGEEVLGIQSLVGEGVRME